MRIARWILCIPAAATAAFLMFVALGKVGVSAQWTRGDFLRSLAGLAPYFVLSSLPSSLFVVCAALVAPAKKKTAITVAALLGGAFSIQAAFFFLTGLPVLDATGLTASFFGLVVGVLLALRLPAVRDEKTA